MAFSPTVLLKMSLELCRSPHMRYFTTNKSTSHPLDPADGKKLCELCQKPATIGCSKCKVTFYCSNDHCEVDWDGIHGTICRDLYLLRSPRRDIYNGEAKKSHDMLLEIHKKRLIALTLTRCRKFLHEGNWRESVPAAMQALQFTIDIYGSDSLELATPFLLLAEASSGLGHFDHAAKYLGQANWIISKEDDLSDGMKAAFFHSAGLFFFAQGQKEEARRYFADQVYCDLEQDGPDDIKTAKGFFQLGVVLSSEGKMDYAMAQFRQVSKVWLAHMEKVFQMHSTPSARKKPLDELDRLDEAQEAEIRKIMETIYDALIDDNAHAKPEDFAAIFCILAMLHLTKREYDLMRRFGKRAFLESMRCRDKGLVSKIMYFNKKTKRFK